MHDEFNARDPGDAATDAHASALGSGIVRTFLVACAGMLTTFLVGTAASLVCILH